MKQAANYRAGQRLAVGGLLTGAVVWGLIWYPYRVIEAAGISGALATTLTYGAGLAVGLILFGAKLRRVRVDGWLVAIALSAAGCNFGYVLATLHGEVMRVLLLFYVAPLWTVLLARLLLNERLTGRGMLVVGLSLAGAVGMLWQPELGIPWPRQSAEWIGLGSGFLFALANVLIRRASHYSIELKSLAIFFGVVVVGLGYLMLFESAAPIALVASGDGPRATPGLWLLVALVGVVLLASNLVVQFGLTHVPATRAAVIFLFELVVAAVGSWWLADEAMKLREWLGGALIVAASVLSARLEGAASVAAPDQTASGNASR